MNILMELTCPVLFTLSGMNILMELTCPVLFALSGMNMLMELTCPVLFALSGTGMVDSDRHRFVDKLLSMMGFFDSQGRRIKIPTHPEGAAAGDGGEVVHFEQPRDEKPAKQQMAREGDHQTVRYQATENHLAMKITCKLVNLQNKIPVCKITGPFLIILGLLQVYSSVCCKTGLRSESGCSFKGRIHDTETIS